MTESDIAVADATSVALAAVPSIPQHESSPVFQAPWEAEAFAMVLALHEGGLFSWSEWASTLAGAISRAQQAGDPDLGDTYYLHWLNALELMILSKGVSEPEQLEQLGLAWQQAATNTPHGEPIELSATDAARLLK